MIKRLVRWCLLIYMRNKKWHAVSTSPPFFIDLISSNSKLNTNLLSSRNPYTCLVQVTRPFDHGEGPHWDERKKRLYFVDAYVGRVHSFDPIFGELHTMQFEGNVTAIFTVKNEMNLFIVANNKYLLGVKWSGITDQGYKRTVLAEVEKNMLNRFNDGKVDRKGRLWIGTMAIEKQLGVVEPNQGNVYRVNPATVTKKKLILQPKLMIAKVSISNGIAWNKENTIMYYIDTSTKKVVSYNFDIDAGTIQLDSAHVIYDFGKSTRFVGAPDGMTLDRDNNLWVALYGGGCIVHINPNTKSVLRVIAIPSRYVTSVIFGGFELDTLYVTTSRRALTNAERLWQPSAGAVFAVNGIPSGYKGTHTNIISAEDLHKINGQNAKDDFWCESNITVTKKG